jgi:nucleotide-binding universal stress UspA family protein
VHVLDVRPGASSRRRISSQARGPKPLPQATLASDDADFNRPLRMKTTEEGSAAMAGRGDRNERRIVVGVDGSEHSHRALRWALEEAKLRHLGCTVVHAWHYSAAAANPYVGMPVPEVEDAAHQALQQDLALTTGSGVEVEGRLVEMSAADALIEASEGAEMLVVGSRGRGGIAAAVLGSVSSACVRHARCPVIVVPSPHGHAETKKSGRPEAPAEAVT